MTKFFQKIKNFLPIWWPQILALLFFGLVSYILLWPLSAHLGQSTTNEGDALQQMWSIGWASHAISRDPTNLFNGNILYPYPNTLAFSEHMLAQTFQAFPLYLLTNGDLILVYGLLTYFSFVLSAWATYLLVRDITHNDWAGLVAGMIFGFAAYKFGHLSQLNLLSTQWSVFCFLFLRRLLRQGQWPTVGLFTLSFILNGLSSWYYFFYILPLLAFYILFFYVGQKCLPSRAILIKLGVAGIIALVFILPVVLPYSAVVAEHGAERTPRDVERFSANYRFYVGATVNNLLWGNSLSRYAGTGGERALFPGLVAYLLTFAGLIIGLWTWLRRKAGFEWRENLVWLFLAGFCLLMSFGWTLHIRGWDIPGLYRLFYDYVPGWVGLRAAVRYGGFVLLAIAVLSGISLSWLLHHSGRWQVLVGILILVGTFWEYRYEVSYVDPVVLPNPPQVYRWLANPAQAGTVLELPAPPDPANPPSIRAYYSTFNWQPLVNGVLAYMPPIEQDIASLTNAFPSPESLAAFQGMGIRWLVYHLEDENTPLTPAQWQQIEARLAKTPQVKLAKDFPADKIKVYELAPNDWMRQAYAGLPSGSGVIVSDYRRVQPILVELFQTMLRRDNYRIYGADRAGYRFLSAPPTGQPIEAGLFALEEDPTLYGFQLEERTWQGYGLAFYRRKKLLAAAYDIVRDTKLSTYNEIRTALDIKIEANGLKFNDQSSGQGKEVGSDLQVNLLLGSFTQQTIKINGQAVNLNGGLTAWHSQKVRAGQSLRLEGDLFYLNRAELAVYDVNSPTGAIDKFGAVLLQPQTVRNGNELKTDFMAYLPSGNYVVTLDIYRKPWGTHPSGHFGTYSIAVAGQEKQPTKITFNFKPLEQNMTALLNNFGADVGKEVFKAAGEGDWTAFLSVRRAEGQDFPLIGLVRLYDFSLDGSNRLTDSQLLASRQFVLLPALK